MANAHRTNVLVTSCLKTPVDPHTKAPLASYERERVLPCTADNREKDLECEFEDCSSDFFDEDYLTSRGPVVNLRASGDRIDLSKIFFSNEEYYAKLEELKKAHLRTMAELESMYRRKLQLKSTEPLDPEAMDPGHRIHWSSSSPSVPHRLRKSQSAVELRYGLSDSSDEDEEEDKTDISNAERHRQFSPKEHIKNMWLDFKLSPPTRHLSSSLHSLDQTKKQRRKKRSSKERWKHRVTVPRPFHMMMREEERRKKGIKTRSEIEHENAELRRQLEELTECQRKFRASPVPAHVHLPLFEELQEKCEERRKVMREENYLKSLQKPFSFIERERLKKEQRQQRKAALSDQEKLKPFKAKPKHLEKRKEVKPTTSCEPFELKTSQISSHRERILAEIEKEQRSPRALRWPYSPEPPRHTPTSSLCSSLSGSTELLPNKSTSAARKRQEAVRKTLEQRRKTEAEEELWREKQRQREKRLQTVVVKRAQANDPHLSLSQTQPSKLSEFRKMDIQRKKEYQQEIKEMRQRVKGRPLLLEQVAQRQRRAGHGLQTCALQKGYLNDEGVESDPNEPETSKTEREESLEERQSDGEREEKQSDREREDTAESEESYSDDHEEFTDDSGQDESREEEV
ncbi:hypothetical protein WMY93_006449 [Mugilogobius chulae]|uniref:Protein FAM161A n=1 Tax=Mugilogobius chulae TaxID=88201 RepID=A0AAW0PVK0_9GOBI